MRWDPAWNKKVELAPQMGVCLGFGGSILTVIMTWAAMYYGDLWPGIPVLLGLTTTGATIFYFWNRERQKKVRRIKENLSSLIPPQHLKKLLANPAKANFGAREHVATLMLIEFSDVSVMIEHYPPDEVLKRINRFYQQVATTVHKHGGTIFGHYNFGMQCFFGYQYADDSTESDHADRAMACAIEIQKKQLESILAADGEIDNLVPPTRIGISTSSLIIGNLQFAASVDYTVIGDGYAQAKILAEGCEPYHIAFTIQTFDSLASVVLADTGFETRIFKTRDDVENLEAHEYDPLYNKQDQKAQGVGLYNKFIDTERIHTRWPVIDRGAIIVLSDFGTGELVDFSLSGLAVDLPKYLAKGVEFSLQFDNKLGGLKVGLRCCELQPLVVCVRWARRSTNGFRHGLKIKGLSAQKREFLISYLRENIRLPETFDAAS